MKSRKVPNGVQLPEHLDIVCCSLEAWDEVWRRNQFFASSILESQPQARILFVEPPVDISHSLTRRHVPRLGGVRAVASYDRLWALTPRKWWPRRIWPHVDRSLARQVVDAARCLGFEKPVLWLNDNTYSMLGYWTEWPVVYDVTDDWTLTGGTEAEVRRQLENDRLALRVAREVVVCSPDLVRTRGACRPVHLIPNGVDLDHLRRPADRPADLPTGRVALYTGTVSAGRLDMDLCVDLAQRLAGRARLVFVGTIACAADESRRLKRAGAVLLGSRPYQSMPAYLQHADVLVVPHVISPFTESLDPIKARELAAVGRPSVVTPAAGFRDLTEPVIVADREHFVAAVEAFLDHPAAPGVGSVIGRPGSWRERAADFLEVLERSSRPAVSVMVECPDEPESPAGRPVWFGSAERPLAGWFHAPASGRVRGGVVICPPLGIEAICVYFTTRLVAERLAEAGIAVVRFDYDGTGDSVGSQLDPDRVDAWKRSVREACQLLADRKVGSLALMGIRMGALIAAVEASSRSDVDAIVLWDPCLSGRHFLREQTAFAAVALGGSPRSTGSVEVPGMLFDATCVEQLGQIDLLEQDLSNVGRILVLNDPDKPGLSRLARRWSGQPVDWAEATGQSDLLDTARQETPFTSIDRVVQWVCEVRSSTASAQMVPLVGPPSATVGLDRKGLAVSERFVQLGPNRLFGIVTESEAPARAPAMVFVNEGNTPHIGQSRMWVELARDWASLGLTVLRWDLSGNADSPPRPGQERHVVRSTESFDDVFEVAQAIRPDDPADVVFIGLCSGAYQSLEAAAAHPARGVMLINPVLTFIPPEWPPSPRRRARQTTRPGLVRTVRPLVRVAGRLASPDSTLRWEIAIEKSTWLAAASRRHPRIPPAFWTAAKRIFTRYRSAGVIDDVVRAGVRVLLVSGNEDLVPITLGNAGTMRRLTGYTLFTLVVIGDLDHSALVVEQRSNLMKVLSRYVERTYLEGGPGSDG